MHVIGICGVYVIARVHLDSARAGAVGGLVYAINPSSIYFDTQYAYESIGINFFVWVIAFASLALRTRDIKQRYAFVASACLTAMACIVTHHLSTVFLIACLATVTATMLVMRRWHVRDGFDVWSTVLVVTGLSAWAWVSTIAKPTLTYLSPYFGGSLGQLGEMATKDSSKGRQVLAASVQPIWERGFAALAPLLLGIVVLYCVVLLRRKTVQMGAATTGLVVFGIVYFLSVPFVLAPSGAEGARRSWGFTYVGIAVIVALVALHLADRLRARRWWLVMCPALVILLVGNVAGGLNDPYRFPKTFRWGTDTNSVTLEARTVGELLHDRLGQVRVISDGYTALQLIAYGRLVVGQPSTGFPAWDLTQTPDDPNPKLADDLETSDFEYLIFDDRIAEAVAFNGYNYGLGDPLLGKVTPQPYLDRLDQVPWAWRVMTTEHVRVYRIDMKRIGIQLARAR